MRKGLNAKWLLTISHQNKLVIKEKEVSIHAPINKVLDKVGDFSFEFIDVNNWRYLIVYESYEEHTSKTKILVARIHDYEERIIDISSGDYENALQIARDYMKCTILVE